MNDSIDPRSARRLLRTLRVATNTALAEYDLGRGRAAARSSASFMALAAKGAGDFRFPEAGILSGDGLVAADVERDAAGEPVRLVLQAQGSAGLEAYAGAAIVVMLGLIEAGGRFDRDGRLVLDLAGLGLDETDLSAFTIGPADATDGDEGDDRS